MIRKKISIKASKLGTPIIVCISSFLLFLFLATAVSADKGFIKIDPNYPHTFIYDNGERYFPMGDTSYFLLSEDENLIHGYIDSRASHDYNFIRVIALGRDFWPFNGGYNNANVNDIDESKMQKLDRLFDYAASKNMNIELLIWGYGEKGGDDMWGDRTKEEDWVEYLVNRYKDRKNLFMWTVTNEFERYDSHDDDYLFSGDLETNWASDMADLIHSYDSNHLVGVHAKAGLDKSYKISGTNLVKQVTWPLWDGHSGIDIYNDFSRDGHLDGAWTTCPAADKGVMLYDTDFEGKTFHPEWTGHSWKYIAPGLEDGIAEDWSKGKPVINTEMGYQYESVKDPSIDDSCQLYDPLTTRSNAWKTVTSGGFIATGFANTAVLSDVAMQQSFIDTWSPEQFEYLYNFMTTKTEYWKMAPHHELTSTHNSLLAKTGSEYIAYFPFGNTVDTKVNVESGDYEVTWLNPRSGQYTGKGTQSLSGWTTFTPPSETSKDWVLHLKKSSAADSTAIKNKKWEHTLTSTSSYSNPYKDVKTKVTFTKGSTSFDTYAFWDGGSTFKIRAAFPEEGVWSWSTECSNANDLGLHNVHGTVQVNAYSGSNPLYQHGLLKASSNGKYIIYEDGTPFFWLGDTWWSSPFQATYSQWQDMVQDRKQKGFNVIQVSPEINGHVEPENVRNQKGDAPFLNFFTKWNPAYWQEYDRFVDYANDNGIVVAIIGIAHPDMWHDLSQLSFSDREAFARNIVARYHGNQVIFVGTFDQVYDSSFDDIGEVMKDATDVHIISQHPGTGHGDTNIYADEFYPHSYYDICLDQSGHRGGNVDLTYYSARVWNKALYDKQPYKPVINAEAFYSSGSHAGDAAEAHMAGTDKIARQLGWISLLNGAKGYTYGAYGLWNFNYATDSGIGVVPYTEALDYSSSTHMSYMKNFFTSMDWWKLEPKPDLIKNQESENTKKLSFELSEDGSFGVGYLPDNHALKLDMSHFSGSVNVKWFNPTQNTYTDGETGVSNSGTHTFTSPSAGEWAVLISTESGSSSCTDNDHDGYGDGCPAGSDCDDNDGTVHENCGGNSITITGITLHTPISKFGEESDNWPITWSNDDKQYAAWGDGWGFNDIHSGPKISLGVSQLSGSATSFTTNDVFEGDPTGSNLNFDSKSYGLISVGGTLYMWTTPSSGGNNYTQARLRKSTNKAASWQDTGCIIHFQNDIDQLDPSALQAGKDYADAEDDFVYFYSIRLGSDVAIAQSPGKIDLFRVQKNSIDSCSFSYFAGMENGEPTWTSSRADRKSILTEPAAGWGPPGVIYNKPLDKYIMALDYNALDSPGHWAIYQADNPWGPWSIVQEYHSDWEGYSETMFFFNFAPKWTSADGKTMYLIGTGGHTSSGNPDAMLLRKVTLTTSTVSGCTDNDHDGYGDGCSAGSDCDDNDASRHNNCNPCVDNDGDSYGQNCPAGSDCDDGNQYVNPGIDEICDNGIDDNCDGQIDEGCDQGNVIYIYTNQANEGTAAYYFDILQSGYYKLDTVINTPQGGDSNSFYIALDGGSARLIPDQVYHTAEASNWAWDSVTLAGNSEDPMEWYLSAGVHTFIIYGREPNTRLDRMVLRKTGDREAVCGDGKCEGSETETSCPSDCRDCQCTSWQSQSCGAEGCSASNVLMTRSCSPDLCQAESKCEYSVSCTGGCTPGSTTACAAGGVGQCASGTKTCTSGGTWGSCIPNQETEVCGNDVDEDCDGQLNNGCEGVCDTDGDGYYSPWCFWLSPRTDCDDDDRLINPGVQEVCGNNKDDDCSHSGAVPAGDAVCPNNNPTINLMVPEPNVYQGTPVIVTAETFDTDGQVKSVRFTRTMTDCQTYGCDSPETVTDNTPPFNYEFTSNHIGTHLITGVAIDDDNGQSSDSTDVSTISGCVDVDNDGYDRFGGTFCKYQGIDCNDDRALTNPGAPEVCGNNHDDDCSHNGLVETGDANCPPSVSITAPSTGTKYTEGDVVELHASANDPDQFRSGITKVDFFYGNCNSYGCDHQICSDTTDPYSCGWTANIIGNTQVMAKTYDVRGGTAVSSIVSLYFKRKVDICGNGIDDDEDGLVDYCDSDCSCPSGSGRLGCDYCASCSISDSSIIEGGSVVTTLTRRAGTDATGPCSFLSGVDSDTSGCENGRSETRTYSNAGSYTVKFEEYKNDGVSDTITCGTVNVGSAAPSACSDGTAYGKCASDKPKYCDNGNLMDYCDLCGCPSGYDCNGYGCSYSSSLKSDGASCSAGSECQSGTCIFVDDQAGECHSCGSAYDGNLCSDDATSFSSSSSGICVKGSSSWTCDKGDVCFDGSDYRSDCYKCSAGSKCDSDVSPDFGANGVCTTDYQECATDVVCKKDSNYYVIDTTKCDNELPCDSDVGSSGFQADGIICDDECVIGATSCGSGAPTCSDGTAYGQCSATKPKYCDNGNLVDNCGICSCSGSLVCEGYGCVSSGNDLKSNGESCVSGDECSGGYCVEGTCRSDCPEGDNDRCSTSGATYTSSSAGVCALRSSSNSGTWICDTNSVCDNNFLKSDCSYCDAGNLCDSDVSGSFSPDGVCDTDDHQCKTGTVCKSGSNYYEPLDSQKCDDGDECDSDVGSSGFQADGIICDDECVIGATECTNCDKDNDGHDAAGVNSCWLYGDANDDCNDNDPNIHPGKNEVCGDGKDNNCDGNIDEGCITTKPNGDSCSKGTDCTSGLCVDGYCRSECSNSYDGKRCSDNTNSYSASASGVCAKVAAGPDEWICAKTEVCYYNNDYWSDCSRCAPGSKCDDNVEPGISFNGVCDTDDHQCKTGTVCKSGSNYYEPVASQKCDTNNPCDSDVGSSGFVQDGTMDSADSCILCGAYGC